MYVRFYVPKSCKTTVTTEAEIYIPYINNIFFCLEIVLIRIRPATGIDPAKPLIRNRLSGRLDPSDADVVQVVHATARYGDLKRMGHVDFCLNGGHVQPICENATSKCFIIFFLFSLSE